MSLDQTLHKAQMKSQVRWGSDWEAIKAVKHLATEVVELSEAVTWGNRCTKAGEKGTMMQTARDDIAGEVADVIIIAAMIAGHLGISMDDVTTSVQRKFNRWLRQNDMKELP